MTVKQNLFFLFVCILFFGACTGSESDASSKINIQELLIGQWELFSANRNGKNAPSMEGTMFRFDANKSMQTNFTGSEVRSAYELDDRTLTQTGGGPKIMYTIDKINQDSLSLTTNIRGFDFILNLKKVPISIPETTENEVPNAEEL